MGNYDLPRTAEEEFTEEVCARAHDEGRDEALELVAAWAEHVEYLETVLDEIRDMAGVGTASASPTEIRQHVTDSLVHSHLTVAELKALS